MRPGDRYRWRAPEGREYLVEVVKDFRTHQLGSVTEFVIVRGLEAPYEQIYLLAEPKDLRID